MWNINQAFAAELRKEHQFACKVELLDTDFHAVDDDTIFSANQTNEISNFISDGSIDVDSSRGIRRTGELTLLNPTAEFTPARDNRGGWVGKIYVNRVIRVWRGLYIAGTPHYVPVGTFMIDNAEIIVERNMSLVNLTLSDLWKKLAKSSAAKAQNWAAGTPYGLIIRDIIEGTGSSYPLAPIIDDLSGRDATDKKISKKLTLEEGDSRGDWLKERLAEWDLDGYFDAQGRMIVQDRKRASDKAVVWHFYSSDDRSGMLQNVTRAYNDDNLYNHVVIIGNGENPVRREKVDTDPNSEISVKRIGDRVYLLKDDKIKNGAQADRALAKAWDIHYSINETIQCDVICNPALEADDVIAITEKTFSKTGVTTNTASGTPGNAYRLQRFTIPLVSSRQTVQCSNIFKEEDFRDYITA